MAAIRFIDRRADVAPAAEPAPAPQGASLGPDAAPDREAREERAVTPMMAQYLGIKAEHPDALLFYRMGDFYELFLEDAVVAASVLGIVLTKRGKHQGEDIAMCGVPVERSDDYLHTLIARGHTVAVCEQTEDPAEAKKRGYKSVVRRAVVRIVTPGTITEERLLEPGRANLLAALSRVKAGDGAWTYGVAAVDISTGAFTVAEVPAARPRRPPRPHRAARDRGAGRLRRRARAAPDPRRGAGRRDPRGARRRRPRRGGAPRRRMVRRVDPRRLRRLHARRARRRRDRRSTTWPAPSSTRGRASCRRRGRSAASRSRSTPRRAPTSR